MYVNPLELMLYVILAIVFVATVCFFCGRAYCHRKHQPMREELERVRKQNEVMKKLSPNLKWIDHAAEKIFDAVEREKRRRGLSPEEFKITRPKRRALCPDDYEIVKQGSPRDA